MVAQGTIAAAMWADPWLLTALAARGSPSVREFDFGPLSKPAGRDAEARVARLLGGSSAEPARAGAARADVSPAAARRASALRVAERDSYRRLPMPRRPLYGARDAGGARREVGRVPLVGLGTWKAEPGQVRSAVSAALKLGYRHVDCASVYQNESEVGEALAAAMRCGGVARDELFVTGKLWNTDHAPARARKAVEKTLGDLQLDYLDLYLVHWPISGNVGPEVRPSIEETWRALEELVDEGLVRALGVSNFSAKKLDALIAASRIPPSVVQVEMHPFWRNDAVFAYCRERGIHVMAYSPLGSPDSASIFPRKKPLDLRSDPTVVEVARELGKDVGQVLIRWALEHGTSVIPKSTSPTRIRGNIDVLGWSLGADAFARLASLPEQQRMVNGASFLNARGPYRTLEELWDEPEGGAVEAEVHGPVEVGPDPAELERWDAAAKGRARRADGEASDVAAAASSTSAGSTATAASSTSAGSTATAASSTSAGSTATAAIAAAVAPAPAPRRERAPRRPLLGAGGRQVGSIPLVGLGTWKSEPGQVKRAVTAALESGYRHVDCASVYQNEHEVGEAIAEGVTRGLVSRDELFVTGKLWNSEHAPARVRKAVERTLKDLRLDYLDLYLIHWPVTGVPGPEVRPPIEDTWRALEALVDEGLIRALGVSNFSAKKLDALIAASRIPPSVVQVEMHPFWRNDALLAYCRERGIHVTAFSPLGSPDSASIFPRKKPLDLRSEPVVQRVADSLGKNVGQVLIRWALEHGTSVIPKSTSPARIEGNIDVFGWSLGPESFAALSSLPEQQRMVNGASFLNPRGPYRTLEEFWDEPEDGVPGVPVSGPVQVEGESSVVADAASKAESSVAAATSKAEPRTADASTDSPSTSSARPTPPTAPRAPTTSASAPSAARVRSNRMSSRAEGGAVRQSPPSTTSGTGSAAAKPGASRPAPAAPKAKGRSMSSRSSRR